MQNSQVSTIAMSRAKSLGRVARRVVLAAIRRTLEEYRVDLVFCAIDSFDQAPVSFREGEKLEFVRANK